MNKQIKLIIGIIVFAIFIAGTVLLYNKLGGDYAPDALVTSQGDTTAAPADDAAPDTEAENSADAAPDFTVIDNDGNEIKLSDFKGTPVVLNFWATWCYYCKKEMPDFNAAYSEYGDEVQFMMVNVTDGRQETVKSAKDYISSQFFAFPVFYDTKLEASSAYKVVGIPATYFIDRDGNIAAQANSMLSAEDLLRGIELIK